MYMLQVPGSLLGHLEEQEQGTILQGDARSNRHTEQLKIVEKQEVLINLRKLKQIVPKVRMRERIWVEDV